MTRQALTLAICAVLLVMAAAFWRAAADLEYPSAVFPKVVIVAFAAVLLATALRAWAGRRTGGKAALGNRRGYAGLGATIAYGFLIPVLGMYTASFVFVVTFLLLQDDTPSRPSAWLRAIASALLVTGAVYLVFDRALKVMTPTGILF